MFCSQLSEKETELRAREAKSAADVKEAREKEKELRRLAAQVQFASALLNP